jgi:hypothetical protein
LFLQCVLLEYLSSFYSLVDYLFNIIEVREAYRRDILNIQEVLNGYFKYWNEAFISKNGIKLGIVCLETLLVIEHIQI